MARVLNISHLQVTNMVSWVATQGVSVTFDEIRAQFTWTVEQAPDLWLEKVLEASGYPVVPE